MPSRMCRRHILLSCISEIWYLGHFVYESVLLVCLLTLFVGFEPNLLLKIKFQIDNVVSLLNVFKEEEEELP